MFYSQFILAKKGPLGTIWLAAHLERKLQKNQIADTDIAVSVDSILFPEVPIALRLSSHLLLGVVRIYSRKVNYLFHDCSEALLKIKQAFRSTVVDLPPEESSAPYHSITLPETFDLDGFELPDSAFQGNDVDHHVSTREQITLQDSVDDTGYTTLPFGLDERFGDGDSSQIHLDIDEGLFMDKIPSPQHASVHLGTEEGMVYEGQPSTSLTNTDIDERPNGCDEHDIFEIPKDLSEVLSNNCDRHAFSSADNLKRSGDSSQRHAYNIQTPDLNLVFFPDEHSDGPSAIQDYDVAADDALSPDLFDHAQAPSTPGLIEETIHANVHEIPTLSPQEKTSSPTAVEVTNMENCVEFEGPSETNNGGLVIDEIMDPEPADNARTLSSVTLVLMEAKPVSLAPECSSGVLAAFDEASLECGQNREDHLQSGFDIRTKPVTLASECLSGFLAEPDGSDEAHLECGHKCEEQLQSGFVCNEVSNLHDDMEAIHPQVDHLDGPVTSIRPLESSNLNIPFNQSTTDNIEAVTPNDNKCVPGKISEIKSTPLSNKADPSIFVNQEHAGDADCWLTNNTSALSSDLYSRLCKSPISLVDISSLQAGTVDPLLVCNHTHVENGSSGFSSNALVPNLDIHLRPCNSSLTQANMLSSEAGALGENAPVFSPGVSTCSFKTPLIEQPLQGEDNNGTTNPVYDQKSETLLSKSDVSKPDDQLTSLSNVSKPDDQLTSLSPKESQLVNLNCCSNLGLPEPEKMLFAPNSDANPPNDFAQLTAEKVASESARKVSRISSLSGNKRRLMDSSSVLQNSNSVKLSGLSRVKRKTPFMPDDDDLLASILVGRTPTLKMGLTPPPKVASRKRPRLTHRIGVPKRKVLLDDTVVLHAEEIRQQLINTEDIRRMRKKAPCTRPEIWMILKSSMEEEIFNESLLTGMSAELNSLHTRKYDMNENTGSQINEDHLDEHDIYTEPYKEMERSRMEEFVRENSGKETGEVTAVMLDGLDSGMQERSGTSISIEAQSCKEAFDVDAQEKLESHVSQLEPSTSSIRNVDERVGIEMPLSFSTPSGNELEISTVSRIEESIHKKCDSVNILREELLQDLVLADRTSNFTGTTVDDIASAEDATRCRVVDSTMQGPPSTSVLTEAQNCKGAVEFDVLDKLVPYIAQLEPSSDSQIISVSKGDVQERVGVETPLICAPHFGNERDFLAAVSSIEEKFIHKKSEAIYVLQEKDLLHDLVQPSDKPVGMADRTSNFPGSAIEEAASAGDVTKCRTVDCVKLAATIENNLDRAVGTSIAKDASISEEANRVDTVDLNSPQYSHDVGKIENGEILVSMLDKCLLEDRAGLPTDSCSDGEHANNHILDRAAGIGESTDVATVSGCHAVDVAPGGEPVVERVLADEERPTSEILCSENPPLVSSFLHQLNTETENVPSAVGEKSVLHECTVECNLDAESTPMDFGAARESSDFCNSIESNDTEFLNVDDEVDFDEAADDDMPDPETSIENSGWSTRTRGVARYLKTLFDDGYGRGKKIVTVDYLLTGKTRKEASRMFFETLVLKTRDYIHVEQEKPFDCLNIKPRPKLLKSEF